MIWILVALLYLCIGATLAGFVLENADGADITASAVLWPLIGLLMGSWYLGDWLREKLS